MIAPQNKNAGLNPALPVRVLKGSATANCLLNGPESDGQCGAVADQECGFGGEIYIHVHGVSFPSLNPDCPFRRAEVACRVGFAAANQTGP
jgi:hypothetical protein